MDLAARRRRRTALLIVGVVLLAALVAFALSLAGTAGRLPWQEEPARVSTTVTPFADLLEQNAPAASPEPAP